MNEIDLDMSVGADDTLHDAQFLLEDREGLVDEQELMVARLRALVAELRVNEVNHKDEIAGLEGRIAGLEGRIAGLEGEVVRLKAENVGLKRKVEEKEDELGKERARKRSFGGRIMPRSGGSMMTSGSCFLFEFVGCLWLTSDYRCGLIYLIFIGLHDVFLVLRCRHGDRARVSTGGYEHLPRRLNAASCYKAFRILGKLHILPVPALACLFP